MALTQFLFGSKEDTAGTVTKIIGGGAYHASDKIIQHNGCGSVSVSGLRPTPGALRVAGADDSRSQTFMHGTMARSTELAALYVSPTSAS